MKNKKLLATNLIADLLKRDWSYAKIASELGKSEMSIRRWEKGKSIPHRFFIEKMEKLIEEEINGRR
uniref:Putative DNA binding, helix-turn-helix domain containing protein n=1 Tax=viral metagenome TaxID=1070528 RepID=A0A6H1Z804_9ZZZZ